MSAGMDMLKTATTEADALAASLARRCTDSESLLAAATALIRAGTAILEATSGRHVAAGIIYQHADATAAPNDKKEGPS
jgi:hypothetical protein